MDGGEEGEAFFGGGDGGIDALFFFCGIELAGVGGDFSEGDGGGEVVGDGAGGHFSGFGDLGDGFAGIELEFSGEKENEIAKVVACRGEYTVEEGTVVLKVDPRYFRPTEVELLIGDASKAKEKLGWEPKYTLTEMAKEMVESDLDLFKRELLLKEGGFEIKNQYE